MGLILFIRHKLHSRWTLRCQASTGECRKMCNMSASGRPRRVTIRRSSRQSGGMTTSFGETVRFHPASVGDDGGAFVWGRRRNIPSPPHFHHPYKMQKLLCNRCDVGTKKPPLGFPAYSACPPRHTASRSLAYHGASVANLPTEEDFSFDDQSIADSEDFRVAVPVARSRYSYMTNTSSPVAATRLSSWDTNRSLVGKHRSKRVARSMWSSWGLGEDEILGHEASSRSRRHSGRAGGAGTAIGLQRAGGQAFPSTRPTLDFVNLIPYKPPA